MKIIELNHKVIKQCNFNDIKFFHSFKTKKKMLASKKQQSKATKRYKNLQVVFFFQ